MELNNIGYNIRHIGDFCIDRPQGSKDYLLLVFKTNARLVMDGEEIILSPNSCILYRKGFPQYYSTCGKTYVDHYVHFECEEENFMAGCGVPLNEPFYLRNPAEAEEIFKLLCREQISTHINRQKNLEVLLQFLLQKVGDNISLQPIARENVKQQERLRDLRAEIYANAGKYASVKELATKMNQSLSHFQVLYQKQFGISCYDDLLTAKIMQAQHHLSYTDLTIKEIAQLCGYENETCFMRCFKKRTGQTPTQYRRGR